MQHQVYPQLFSGELKPHCYQLPFFGSNVHSKCKIIKISITAANCVGKDNPMLILTFMFPHDIHMYFYQQETVDFLYIVSHTTSESSHIYPSLSKMALPVSLHFAPPFIKYQQANFKSPHPCATTLTHMLVAFTFSTLDENCSVPGVIYEGDFAAFWL